MTNNGNNNDKKLFEKIKYKIELISPVHIGSGYELIEGFDYISNNGKVRLYSKEQISKYLKENFEILKDDIEKPNFKPLNYKNNLEPIQCFDLYPDARSIKEFIKNGFGKPYIPGSSIKGALRTVIFSHFFQDSDLKNINYDNYQFSSNRIVERIFGREINKNFMRAIAVEDAYFEPNNLVLNNIKLLNKVNNNKAEIKKGTRLTAQFLDSEYESTFHIIFNSFLMNNNGENRIANPFNKPVTITKLFELTNEFSKRLIQNEIDFLSSLDNSGEMKNILFNLVLFYSNLKKQIESNSNNTMYLRIGSGSGWRFMTGNVITKNHLKNVVENFIKSRNHRKLFKHDNNYEPKTRKIVETFTADETKYVFPGWVKITKIG